MRRQLEGDVKVVAAQLSGSQFRQRRHMWAGQLAHVPFNSPDLSERRNAMINYRLATILDPNNASALNNLAWSLVSVPTDPWFEPTHGLALARKAVAREPNAWNFLNTLGVAAFRVGDWDTATRVLQQSITFTGGGAHDLFFLAMTSWHKGSKEEAQSLYDRAVAWTENNKPNDPELVRFRAEAAALLGHPCPNPTTPATRPGVTLDRISQIALPEDCLDHSCSASCGDRAQNYSTAGNSQPSLKKPAAAIPPGARGETGTSTSTTAKSGSFGT
jgi:hypothetical protein